MSGFRRLTKNGSRVLPMLKFFLEDYAGWFLFAIIIAGVVLVVKEGWFYGAIMLATFIAYLAAVVMYGLTYRG